MKKRREKEKKEKGIVGISLSYPLYTVEGSCFAKCSSKTVLDSLKNLLHQHSHNRSCHNRSHSSTKHTLY
jgi:hypothetical protein